MVRGVGFREYIASKPGGTRFLSFSCVRILGSGIKANRDNNGSRIPVWLLTRGYLVASPCGKSDSGVRIQELGKSDKQGSFNQGTW